VHTVTLMVETQMKFARTCIRFRQALQRDKSRATKAFARRSFRPAYLCRFLDPPRSKGRKNGLKLVCCPRSLAPTLVALPSMSLIPSAPLISR